VNFPLSIELSVNRLLGNSVDVLPVEIGIEDSPAFIGLDANSGWTPGTDLPANVAL